MIGPIPRRLFLKMGLALPASAAAAPAFGAMPLTQLPPSRAVKWAYLEWLDQERRLLHHELFPDWKGRGYWIPANTGAAHFHWPLDGRREDVPPASTRAIPVLGAVGLTVPEIEANDCCTRIYRDMIEGRR